MKYLNALSLFAAIFASALTLGCGAAAGTQSHDMSAKQHDAMAENEESAATGHAERHDTSATKATAVCPGKGGCWTSTSTSLVRAGR